MELNMIIDEFINLYGGDKSDLRVFRSPGRVNMIGEHTDYNGGFVFPAALTMSTTIVVRKRNDNVIRLKATDLDVIVEADTDKLNDYRDLKWGNYQLGVAYMLKEAGYDIVGCDMLYDDTTPHGSGLSSSAAIEVSTALAFATLHNEKNGITEEVAKQVTKNPEVLNRVLGDGKTTVGEILAKQFSEGQNNYINPNSALYDLGILGDLLTVLIIVAAIGALMNVIPYFWYDFNERKQQSVVRVLKVRAMYEDYGNGALKDEDLVEGVDIIRNSREMAVATPKVLDKKSYKNISDKEQKKAAKKAYTEAKQFNEGIEIAKFVCAELDKYSNPVYYAQLEQSRRVFSAGLHGLLDMNINEINAEISSAKAMPKSNEAEKEARSKAIDIAKNKKVAFKEIRKNFSNPENFVQPDFAVLENYFDEEDECDDILKKLYLEKAQAKKTKDNIRLGELKDEIKAVEEKRKLARENGKKEMEKHAIFNRAAKPYLDAEKMVRQYENYQHFDEIAVDYEEAKQRVDAKRAADEAERLAKEAEEKAFRAQLKAEKKAKKK